MRLKKVGNRTKLVLSKREWLSLGKHIYGSIDENFSVYDDKDESDTYNWSWFREMRAKEQERISKLPWYERELENYKKEMSSAISAVMCDILGLYEEDDYCQEIGLDIGRSGELFGPTTTGKYAIRFQIGRPDQNDGYSELIFEDLKKSYWSDIASKKMLFKYNSALGYYFWIYITPPKDMAKGVEKTEPEPEKLDDISSVSNDTQARGINISLKKTATSHSGNSYKLVLSRYAWNLIGKKAGWHTNSIKSTKIAVSRSAELPADFDDLVYDYVSSTNPNLDEYDIDIEARKLIEEVEATEEWINFSSSTTNNEDGGDDTYYLKFTIANPSLLDFLKAQYAGTAYVRFDDANHMIVVEQMDVEREYFNEITEYELD